MSQLGRAELARLSVRDYRKRSKLRSTGKHRFAGNRVEPSLLGWGGRKRSKLRSTGKHRSAGNRVEPSLLVWGGRKRSKLRSTGKHRFAVIV